MFAVAYLCLTHIVGIEAFTLVALWVACMAYKVRIHGEKAVMLLNIYTSQHFTLKPQGQVILMLVEIYDTLLSLF